MLTLCKPPRARKPKAVPTAGREILRITEGDFVVGDVLLDGLERVLTRVPLSRATWRSSAGPRHAAATS